MADIDARTGNLAPSDSLVRITHVIYALHAFSAVTGLLGTAFVVTAFLTGWPSLIAVIINYAKRSEVQGSYLESHFRWQIRTFWFALLWVLVAILFWVTLLGIPFAVGILAITGLWVLYRIGRGWLRLADRKPMPL